MLSLPLRPTWVHGAGEASVDFAVQRPRNHRIHPETVWRVEERVPPASVEDHFLECDAGNDLPESYDPVAGYEPALHASGY